jgi:hypothetical protein
MAAAPLEKPAVAAEAAGLEGEITVKARQLTPKMAEIVVKNGIAGVGAITVSVPELEQDLVQLTRDAFKPELEAKRGLEPLARLSFGLPALEGTFQTRFDYDLDASRSLLLVLLLEDGRSVPVRIHTAGSLAGLEASVVFKLNACYTVTLTCSQCSPSTLTETCCNLPIQACADCPKCSLSCHACPAD